MKIKRPHILLEGIQIKSVEKFRLLAAAINVIEEECGIYEVKITLKDIFFCPWIDIEKCRNTPMERLLINMIQRLK